MIRPPFTIQRLCELTLCPEEHHPNVWKYLRALEKVLLVTSLQTLSDDISPPNIPTDLNVRPAPELNDKSEFGFAETKMSLEKSKTNEAIPMDTD